MVAISAEFGKSLELSEILLYDSPPLAGQHLLDSILLDDDRQDPLYR